MRRCLAAALLVCGLAVAGCGWSPPSAAPPEPDTCTASDGPPPDTVTSAITALPPTPQGQWLETRRGHTGNCRLYWVQVGAGAEPGAAQHLLLFDRATILGPATKAPQLNMTVLSSGEKSITVQYQWQQAGDAPAQPTGIGQVRFQLADDGKLQALDPIPNQ